MNEIGIQQPLPLAFVHGEAVIEKPEDLYIPPDALEVILDGFSGPLDLLFLSRSTVRYPRFVEDYATVCGYVELMTALSLTCRLSINVSNASRN